jgi:hypothetical protein
MEPIYFNTKFIYRFSDDGIIDFGGKEENIIDVDTVTWNKKDILTANRTLQKMKEELNLPDPEFTRYSKDKDGTQNMLSNLITKGDIPNKYLLGCVICHQLQYRVPLEATFMSGKPNLDYHSESDDDNF